MLNTNQGSKDIPVQMLYNHMHNQNDDLQISQYCTNYYLYQ